MWANFYGQVYTHVWTWMSPLTQMACQASYFIRLNSLNMEGLSLRWLLEEIPPEIHPFSPKMSEVQKSNRIFPVKGFWVQEAWAINWRKAVGLSRPWRMVSLVTEGTLVVNSPSSLQNTKQEWIYDVIYYKPGETHLCCQLIATCGSRSRSWQRAWF